MQSNFEKDLASRNEAQEKMRRDVKNMPQGGSMTIDGGRFGVSSYSESRNTFYSPTQQDDIMRRAKELQDKGDMMGLLALYDSVRK